VKPPRCVWLAACLGLGACALDPVSIADEQVDGDGGGDGVRATGGNATDGDASDGSSETGTDGGGGDGNTSSTGDEGTGAQSGGGTTGGDSDGGTTFGQLETCEEIIAAFDAETTAIRACSSEVQCGQVLGGTSCGCTRDWVARLDADLTQWEFLLTLAGQMECEIGLASPCDCPAADGYACVDQACTWNYQ